MYTFKVQGQVYHFLNSLTLASNPGSNMQLFFHDVELSNRKAACPRLSKNVIKKIMPVLANNPYAKFFKSLSNVPNLASYKMILRTLPGVDQRVYNKPTES